LMIEAMTVAKHEKVYNSTTHDPVSIKEVIQTTEKVTGKKPELKIASKEFLEKNKVGPWSDLPLWLNGKNLIIDHSKLQRDFSYTLTPFEESVLKTVEYYKSINWPVGTYGLSLDKEKKLISKLK